MSKPARLRLRLPATSANLGPGFDAVGLAMKLYLHVEAEVGETFRVSASGRNAELTGALENNLLLETYRALAPHGPALRLKIENEIPLGMGCGSSAAALLAGVMLANHFGQLGLSEAECMTRACRLEGHPDNVAACRLGGFTVSAMDALGEVTAVTMGAQLPWLLMLAVPSSSFSTSKARGLLPSTYARGDAVRNVQATALLVAAFALGRPELLAAGTRDWMHQPYRSEACPLLPLLLPLAGADGVYAVTLSGAGPAVLLCADWSADVALLRAKIQEAAGSAVLEVIATGIGEGATWVAF